MERARAFLADDHSDFLKAEALLLEPHFELVGTACNGASLVTEAQRLKPDVIILDISMPVMNGIEAMQKLTQCGSTAKVVFLTVETGEQFVDACLAEGAQGYVWKPLMHSHLVPAILAVLNSQRYVSPLRRL